VIFGLRLLTVAFAVLLLDIALAEAQQPIKVARIAFLDSSTFSGMTVLLDAFRQELIKLGWVEGKNVSVEYRFAEQNLDRLPELAAELARLKVDLIVVTGTPPALAAKKATSTIPIVIANTADPLGEGLVAGLARPGGNVTGLSALTIELNTKRLEILKDTIPSLTRVALLRPGTGASLQMNAIMTAAAALKVKVDILETQLDRAGMESVFETVKQRRIGGIITVTSRRFFTERKLMVELADKYRVPAIYFQKEFADEGGLMSYGVDFGDQFRKAAHYVDKILKGAKPADLPVEQPTKFELAINLKTAKQIGLTIPPQVLARADRVIR
jgi:putative ABC transport system substrate-binding protein